MILQDSFEKQTFYSGIVGVARVWACLNTPRAANFAEFSFHARKFCEGVLEEKAVKDAPERVFKHALASFNDSIALFGATRGAVQ
ncbi:hypothetical protein [Cohnella phaseoli]|uniref:hypothetical protein n=1 Tax=Cohnella phaseoli TaxID=456490 RepID=UPI0011C029AF|nr:hypothetical protein [Cohnella phaseoli]